MSFFRLLFLCTAAALLALAAVPARADRDVVQFGNAIVVPENSSIHDAVCFFCSVDARGPIDHDLVVFFGDVHIASAANHDIVSFFGDVKIDSGATVTHDLVHFFGDVHMGDHASIGNDMVLFFGDLKAADSAMIAGNRIVQPAWLLMIPFLFIGGFVFLIVNLVRSWRMRHYYYVYPPHPPAPPTAGSPS